jgi:HAD superfamily 5'-nucleotidase-like hydrolase
MNIFVNRTLNLKRIKAIGFDMDYTLVRYHSENFEKLAFEKVLQKLVDHKGYPASILEAKFDYHLVIQGLVIDKRRGNLLKLSRFGQVKQCQHGLTPISFKEQQEIYLRNIIDISENRYQSLDTSFSISNGVLFAILVDLKDKGLPLPSYEILSDEIKECIDIVHAEGPLKQAVKDNISHFIVQDPEIPLVLEKLKRDGKKLLVITNSEYSYTKLLLDYAIQPYLKENKHWSDLFELTITLAQKPRFFTDRNNFLQIDPSTGHLMNFYGPVTQGIFQGGNAKKLQKDLGLTGDEILYLGDHIYGDVVSIKKSFNWRTGLVLEPLIHEREKLFEGKPCQDQIDLLMEEKMKVEWEYYKVAGGKEENQEAKQYSQQLDALNAQLGQLIQQYAQLFNERWGELMRAGQEESYIAGQVEKYACIYMSKISDLLPISSRMYFRPRRRVLPHEYL